MQFLRVGVTIAYATNKGRSPVDTTRAVLLPDVLNMAALGFEINIPSEPEPVVDQSNDFFFWLAVLSVGIVGLGAIDSDIA